MRKVGKRSGKERGWDKERCAGKLRQKSCLLTEHTQSASACSGHSGSAGTRAVGGILPGVYQQENNFSFSRSSGSQTLCLKALKDNKYKCNKVIKLRMVLKFVVSLNGKDITQKGKTS